MHILPLIQEICQEHLLSLSIARNVNKEHSFLLSKRSTLHNSYLPYGQLIKSVNSNHFCLFVDFNSHNEHTCWQLCEFPLRNSLCNLFSPGACVAGSASHVRNGMKSDFHGITIDSVAVPQTSRLTVDLWHHTTFYTSLFPQSCQYDEMTWPK